MIPAGPTISDAIAKVREKAERERYFGAEYNLIRAIAFDALADELESLQPSGVVLVDVEDAAKCAFDATKACCESDNDYSPLQIATQVAASVRSLPAYGSKQK